MMVHRLTFLQMMYLKNVSNQLTKLLKKVICCIVSTIKFSFMLKTDYIYCNGIPICLSERKKKTHHQLPQRNCL